MDKNFDKYLNETLENIKKSWFDWCHWIDNDPDLWERWFVLLFNKRFTKNEKLDILLREIKKCAYDADEEDDLPF